MENVRTFALSNSNKLITQTQHKMKKIVSLAVVLAAMLFIGKANAQISIHAGYQNYSLKSEFGSLNKTESEGGFYAGLSYNTEVGAGLGVAPGLYFSYVEDIIDIRVPILLNWGINFGEIGVGVFAGPNINIGLAGDAYTDELVKKNRFDLGVTFGGKVSYQSISVEVGYNLGLLNQLKDAPDGYTLKANQFFVGVGYTL